MKIRFPGENLKTMLHAPHISEKSTILSQQNQYVFTVDPSATKKQISLAVEKYYEVEVKSVNVANVRGKAKGSGHNKGRRRHWKKAYVTLEEGSTITSAVSE